MRAAFAVVAGAACIDHCADFKSGDKRTEDEDIQLTKNLAKQRSEAGAETAPQRHLRQANKNTRVSPGA